jgi:hypothetical protein
MSVLPDMSFCAHEICGLEIIGHFRTEALGPHIISEIVSAAPIPDDEHLQVILDGRRVSCVSGLQR